MKLRLAKKINKTIGTEEAFRYTENQKNKACDRLERTESSKLQQDFWNSLMMFLGPSGRAALLTKQGRTKDAFTVLMNNPEESWPGKPTIFRKE